MPENTDEVDLVACPACDHGIELNFERDDEDNAFLVEEGELFEDVSPGFAQLAQQMLQERVIIICGACGSKIKIGRQLAGQKIHCIACSREIFIPFLDEGDAFDDLMQGDEIKSEILEPLPQISRRSSSKSLKGRKARKKLPKRPAPQRVQESVIKKSYIFLALGAVGFVILVAIISSFFTSDLPDPDISPPYSNGGSTSNGGGSGVDVPNSNNKSSGSIALLSDPQYMTFAVDSRYPARAGYMFCRLEVSVTAQRSEVALDTKRIKLKLNHGECPCFGEPVDSTVIPMLARHTAYTIRPGLSKTVNLLFEVPATKSFGNLVAGNMISRLIRLNSPGRIHNDTTLVGRYNEAGYRNMKPLLENPVMAAVQQSEPGSLMISRVNGKQELRIDIPKASVTGWLSSPDSRGVCKAKLSIGSEELGCKIGLLPAGEGLILYLKDERMHQITYTRHDYSTGD